MNLARSEYYSNLIANSGSDQTKLFRTTRTLLCEPPEVTFPGNIPPNDLANNFGNFFIQKIVGINKSLDALQSMKTLDCKNAGDGCACAAMSAQRSLISSYYLRTRLPN